MKWCIETSIVCCRPERVERPDRMERERGIVGGRPNREQSSRPPPPSQSKAKDPMKLIGLKSNIKLSLVSKVGIVSTSNGPDNLTLSVLLARCSTRVGGNSLALDSVLLARWASGLLEMVLIIKHQTQSC